MSGCDAPIRIAVSAAEYDRIVAMLDEPPKDKPKLRALLADCDCDHGEDDPCCSEPTEPPTDDEAA